MSTPVETLAFLREVRLFKDIAEPELMILGQSLVGRPLRRGQVICREGDPGEEMFVVRSGSIALSARSRGLPLSVKGSATMLH